MLSAYRIPEKTAEKSYERRSFFVLINAEKNAGGYKEKAPRRKRSI